MGWFGSGTSGIWREVEKEEEARFKKAKEAYERMRAIQKRFNAMPEALSLNDGQKALLLKMYQDYRVALQEFIVNSDDVVKDCIAYKSDMKTLHLQATGRTPEDVEKDWKLELDNDFKEWNAQTRKATGDVVELSKRFKQQRKEGRKAA
ncbi:hypothetical protein HY772_00750 [Candidatus Woesearchaeota archaeon]|nr:hypothetical protein [Candidatus Woesearchaeota archaeon]